ncbi:MAG: hypothetical protein KDE20_26565, partial [Caldilineaceae bacterium]|nr:hypothetical protein [Caldilineaceae bacterium]
EAADRVAHMYYMDVHHDMRAEGAEYVDVSDVYARRAVELGCKIAINSDAHEVSGMEVMPYGIGTARRAWLTAADVVNTRPVAEMLALLKSA